MAPSRTAEPLFYKLHPTLVISLESHSPKLVAGEQPNSRVLRVNTLTPESSLEKTPMSLSLRRLATLVHTVKSSDAEKRYDSIAKFNALLAALTRTSLMP